MFFISTFYLFQFLYLVSISHQKILINDISKYKSKLTPSKNITSVTSLGIDICGNFTNNGNIFISRDLQIVFQYSLATNLVVLNFNFIIVRRTPNCLLLTLTFREFFDDDTYWEITNDDAENSFELNTILIDMFFVHSIKKFKLVLKCQHFFSNSDCSRNRINDIVLLTCSIELGEEGQPIMINLPEGATSTVMKRTRKSVAVKTQLLKILASKTATCSTGSYFTSSNEPYQYMVDVFDSGQLATAAKAVTASFFGIGLAVAIALAIYYIFILPMKNKNKAFINHYLDTPLTNESQNRVSIKSEGSPRSSLSKDVNPNPAIPTEVEIVKKDKK